MVEVLLCQTVLDIDQSVTFDFENKTSQENYFRRLPYSKSVLSNCIADSFRTSIMVECSFDELLRHDYLFINGGLTNKYYYFILDKKSITKKVTELTLKLDVFQTYMFDYNIGKSFVERCHVPRWDGSGFPTNNNVDEGLEYGTMVIDGKEDIYKFPLNYIMVTTSPIGKLQTNTQGNYETSLGGGDVSKGKVSFKYIRYLKGVEGFNQKPIDEGDGCLTFGYGVTKENDGKYYQMLEPEPVSEKTATLVLIDLINEKYAKPVYNLMQRKGVDMGQVPQNIFDSFVDVCYNCGIGGLQQLETFKTYCNSLSTSNIEPWFTHKIMVGTKFEKGLRNRRKTEIRIFQSNIYDMEKIAIHGGNGGYIENDGYLPTNDTNDIQDKLLKNARELIGKPYIYGGTYPNNGGTDCSGLCQYAYSSIGISIPRTTYTQIKIGKKVSSNELKSGDLVFSRFNKNGEPEHVFLYSGFRDNKHYCIEAPRTGLLIREKSFDIDGNMQFRRII